jgi:uncharacterized membrane protein YfhO
MELVLLSFSFGHGVACPSVLFLLTIVLLVRLFLFFGHCVACPSVSFLLAIVLFVFLSLFFGHFVACPFVPVLLAIVLLGLLSLCFGHQKDKQQNGQRKGTEGQATQWPKKRDRRTSNTMAKRK